MVGDVTRTDSFFLHSKGCRKLSLRHVVHPEGAWGTTGALLGAHPIQLALKIIKLVINLFIHLSL